MFMTIERSFIDSVAQALGRAWVGELGWEEDPKKDVEQHEHSFLTLRPWNRAQVTLRFLKPGRLEAAAVFPTEWWCFRKRPEGRTKSKYDRIFLSDTKGPEGVAKQIARRLLPDYLGELKAVEKAAADQDHIDRATLKMAQALISKFHLSPLTYDCRGESLEDQLLEGLRHRGQIRLVGDDRGDWLNLIINVSSDGCEVGFYLRVAEHNMDLLRQLLSQLGTERISDGG